MSATVSRISSRREVYVHLDLDEPVVVDMLPMPLRTNPDVNPDPVVRALVILRTLDGVPEPPILTLSTGRGRHVTAGIGQNPDERNDTLLQRFAHLIDAARERVARQDAPPYLVDTNAAARVAPVRHLGTTDTPALHVCRHGRDGHLCECPLSTDHGTDQAGAACGIESSRA